MKKIVLMVVILATAAITNAQSKTNKTTVPKTQLVKADTTQPAAKETWYLLGYKENFQLLYKSLVQHDDVTPNQIKALADWLAKEVKQIPADTTGKK